MPGSFGFRKHREQFFPIFVALEASLKHDEFMALNLDVGRAVGGEGSTTFGSPKPTTSDLQTAA